MGQETIQLLINQLIKLVDRHKDSNLDVVAVPMDLMERVLEEIKRVDTEQQITQKQLIQNEKMAILGRLIAGIIHEINTPIASINSNINLFARSLDKIITILNSDAIPDDLPSKRQMIQVVNMTEKLNQTNQTACDRIIQMVQSIRSFTRVDIAELREVDIHEELEKAITLVYHELKRRINVVRNYGNIPRYNCFPDRLNSVFINILVNASQAIEKDGQIIIETSSDENTIKVKFTDTGHGIPAENIDKLFELGFTTKPPDQGTGWGLAICKKIVEEHHGKIEVESKVGEGSAFTVILPVNYENLT